MARAKSVLNGISTRGDRTDAFDAFGRLPFAPCCPLNLVRLIRAEWVIFGMSEPPPLPIGRALRIHAACSSVAASIGVEPYRVQHCEQHRRGTPTEAGEITVPTGLQPVFVAPSFVLPSSLCSRDMWACPFPPADKNTGSMIVSNLEGMTLCRYRDTCGSSTCVRITLHRIIRIRRRRQLSEDGRGPARVGAQSRCNLNNVVSRKSITALYSTIR